MSCSMFTKNTSTQTRLSQLYNCTVYNNTCPTCAKPLWHLQDKTFCSLKLCPLFVNSSIATKPGSRSIHTTSILKTAANAFGQVNWISKLSKKWLSKVSAIVLDWRWLHPSWPTCSRDILLQTQCRDLPNLLANQTRSVAKGGGGGQGAQPPPIKIPPMTKNYDNIA